MVATTAHHIMVSQVHGRIIFNVQMLGFFMFQCDDRHSFWLPAYFSNRLHSGKEGLCIPGSSTFYFPTKIRFQFIHSDTSGGEKIGGFILVTGTLERKRIKWPSLCLEVTVYCLKLKLGCQYAFITRTVFQQGLVSLIMAQVRL